MQTPSTLANAANTAARSSSEFTGRPGALQLPRRVVAIDADQQRIAEIARRFEISDVAQMQNVEAAIGDDEFFAGRAKRLAPLRQFVPRR